MKRIPRRLFTEEFKREAIKLVTEQQRIRELEQELAVAKMECDILKKVGVLRKGSEVRCAMVDQLRHYHPVYKLCYLLGVARSGYQTWRAGKIVSSRKLEDVRLVVAIKAAHARGRGIYGPLKVLSELQAQGVHVGLNRIKRLRKLHGIRCTHKKKFSVTTDSKHRLPLVKNLLDRQFSCTQPNQVWVADITYIPTREGWLYLAAIKDLYTCEIVGWSMDSRMTQTLVINALTAAYWKKKPASGLMHHSCEQGIEVWELNRPDRAKRRLQGKSDPTDAESAARTVLSGNATATPESQSGVAETLRMYRLSGEAQSRQGHKQSTISDRY